VSLKCKKKNLWARGIVPKTSLWELSTFQDAGDYIRTVPRFMGALLDHHDDQSNPHFIIVSPACTQYSFMTRTIRNATVASRPLGQIGP